MRAKLFRNGRSQAVRLPAEFRFEGTEVEIARDPETEAVVLTPVRPSARALLELRDALPQEPGFQAELDAFFEGLHDTRPAEPVDFP
ncbi:MAG: antitoxin [Cyanobium sp.]